MPYQHLSTLIHLAATRARARSSDGQRGSGLVEYLLLLAFIAMLVIVVVQAFGGKVSSVYSSANSPMP